MRLLFIVVFSFISLVANAQFRNTTWRLDKQEVKKIETEKLFYDSNNSLSYKFVVEDMECILLYSFNDKDQLITITYTFSKRGRYDNVILESTIKNITDKYGAPSDSRDQYSVWNTDKFSIRVMSEYEKAKVIYSPPAPSQKDIL